MMPCAGLEGIVISDTPDTQKSPHLWSISQHPHSEKVKELWGGNPSSRHPKTYSAVSHSVMSAPGHSLPCCHGQGALLLGSVRKLAHAGNDWAVDFGDQEQ